VKSGRAQEPAHRAAHALVIVEDRNVDICLIAHVEMQANYLRSTIATAHWGSSVAGR
jgi:hypothetical protein